MQTAEPLQKLIPPPGLVRVELARSARETRQLRALLKLSLQAEEDRRFIESQADRLQTTEAAASC